LRCTSLQKEYNDKVVGFDLDDFSSILAKGVMFFLCTTTRTEL
jgi:hypothetical protein